MPKDRGYRWRNVGKRIREARTRAGLTQREVGERVGVNTHTVWCWEAGRMKPNHDHLVDLAFHCAVSTDWILGRDEVESDLLKEAEVSVQRGGRRPSPGRRGVDPQLHPVRE